MNAQGLGDAGAKLFRLNQHGDQIAHAVDLGALGEVLPGVGARAAGALLQHDNAQFVADFGLRQAQFFGGARRRLVQAQSGLDADDQQIEHIGQAEPNTRLPLRDPPAQPEIRRQKSQVPEPRHRQRTGYSWRDR